MIEFSFVDCFKESGWNCCCKYAEEKKESQLHNRVMEARSHGGLGTAFTAENKRTQRLF
jgi:hypothetical protein